MSDLTEADLELMRGVVNRHGRDENAVAFQNIFERLEVLEAVTQNLPPGLGGKPPLPEVDPTLAGAEAEPETVPQTEEGTGSEEGQSSSNPESEPATQSQSQSY